MCAAYVQEAEQIVRLMIWEVHCWTEETITNTPDQIIPFVQRVVLGRGAELEGHKLMYNQQPENEDSDSEGGRASDGDEENVEEKKEPQVSPDAFSEEHLNETGENGAMEEENPADTFEYKPIGLTLAVMCVHVIYVMFGVRCFFFSLHFLFCFCFVVSHSISPTSFQWESADMVGNPSNAVTQKGQRLEELRIATCPMYGDAGFPPNPTEQGVAQMYASLVNSAKRAKQEEEYRLLATEPSQHIRSVTVSVDKAEHRMWILVDGRLYGSFARIRVAPMVDMQTKKQIFMPIKTFFPISL
ncbi:hypothetical protein RFI_17000 [Reticulomyxa filosa]|uniref:Uncharacterized protein n=1 Tax=Reticulomyxa filosa TaxID=46433 RepID=X6N295_RETFI|nr:hypothetical protein RFI_17000 [Reticulomyxa filosa]|eukprot:ETO20216.1 hypothetical protein RFI_17000 [Reticulomyxa filosa]